ncbi:MAG: hypothetical protein DMG56_04080 [Acidobacteria bacterium]|nr:MAG: hypothetical protein DMG34_03990 [Acidobacteriota bacterium]PYU65243.1 MAG: hypothetical protein DMG56_04080 [Acidobacteriota bacterium]
MISFDWQIGRTILRAENRILLYNETKRLQLSLESQESWNTDSDGKNRSGSTGKSQACRVVLTPDGVPEGEKTSKLRRAQ